MRSSGRLAGSGGHAIAWDARGDDGAPWALALHGGPGSGRSESAARRFDPDRWRLARFDQRGCGCSAPHAADLDVDQRAAFARNTTDDLIDDIEALRAHLGVARWLVFGSSWGATLALAYAQAHPTRVSALVLAAVTTTSAEEVAWITEGAGVFLPEAHAAFAAHVAADRGEGRLVDAYADRLMSPDPTVHAPAAQAWAAWEQALAAVDGAGPPHPRWSDPRFRLAFARLTTHYWRNLGFRAERPILSRMDRISHIPGALIHGRLDVSGPAITPWRLAQAWPAARLTLIDRAGHDGAAPDMDAAIRSEIDRLRRVARA